MSNPDFAAEKSIGRRFVPALALAFFATGMLDVMASLFLTDIAVTFLGSNSKSAVFSVSLMVTVSAAVAVAAGVLGSFLSIRLKHRFLLLVGALFIVIGSIGCYLAPSLTYLFIFYPFDGAGSIIVGAMCFSLIGEFLPLEKRAKAVGWVTAGAILSPAIGFPIAGFIAGIAEWRFYLLWYVMPISVIAIILAFFSIPKVKKQRIVGREAYVSSFKRVLFNKSAVACLVGNVFIFAAGVWSFFAATFWRLQFFLTVQIVGIISFVLIVVYSLGSVVGGRLVNKTGRKRLVVASWFARGLLIPAILFMPDFWTALLMSFFATLVGGIAVASGHSLNLEQAPTARGTMMSLGAMATSIGVSLGTFAGGIALDQFGFQILGVTLGIFGVVSAFVIAIFAKDPCKTNYSL